ncbi:MAG: hypothetical protein DRR06_02595 [Gammaproteobacteria bacterium]|nr:MAG: hypothetical protein DRR06_02595 [Gammaproteobacteria bacterium]RLA53384.1 MAG: hypothetical protein DRR42_05035 [Gammaproteobacteria bacterium]
MIINDTANVWSLSYRRLCILTSPALKPLLSYLTAVFFMLAHPQSEVFASDISTPDQQAVQKGVVNKRVTHKGMWRTPGNLTASEQRRVDINSSSSDRGTVSYLPTEEWPFEAPFSAQEIGYRVMDFSHVPRWSHVMADAFGVLTKAGYLTQGVTVGMVEQISAPGALTQIESQPGDIYSRQIYFDVYPPKNKGLQQMWLMRRSGADNPTKLDFFIYSPSLRRVRRQPPPRRETQFPDMVQSFDDITGREAWEFDWRLLGADTLYKTVRFPINRETITLGRANGSYYDVPTAEIKMMGERYPFYRTDGGVDCFVVEAKPNRDWLPNYEISKLIYWVDQFYFYPLRIEQYNENGELKTVQVRLARHDNTKLAEGYGYSNNLSVYYDLQQDLLSYSLHDAIMVREWSEEELTMFTPDFMRRRWLKYPQQSQALVDSPEQFYLRPQLLKDRFPEERPIKITEDVVARIKEQNKNGYLKFSESD